MGCRLLPATFLVGSQNDYVCSRVVFRQRLHLAKSLERSFPLIISLHPPAVQIANSQQHKMDQILAFVEPGRKFTKDSIRLVKRCTKPDRKGLFFCSVAIQPGSSSSQSTITRFLSFLRYRVSKDRDGHCHWLCHHGIHRLFR